MPEVQFSIPAKKPTEARAGQTDVMNILLPERHNFGLSKCFCDSELNLVNSSDELKHKQNVIEVFPASVSKTNSLDFLVLVC